MDFVHAVWDSLPQFLEAGKITLALSAVSILMTVPLGGMIAGFAMSAASPLRWLAIGYIGVIRGTPLITQIFIIYFGLTSLLVLPPFWATAFALTVHNSAYIAEIFRSGFESVPRGLNEA